MRRGFVPSHGEEGGAQRRAKGLCLSNLVRINGLILGERAAMNLRRGA